MPNNLKNKLESGVEAWALLIAGLFFAFIDPTPAAIFLSAYVIVVKLGDIHAALKSKGATPDA